MPNPFFKFKEFTVYHDRSAMKVTTDSCFFGAWAAGELKNAGLKIENVLDIGTGTGLLSLMIAQKSNANIDAVEIDTDAAEQAKENVLSSPWMDRINIFNENVHSFPSNKKYECIICNPPFYEKELNSEQEKKNLAHHSSLLTIAQVVEVIKQNLNTDGIFFLLYPFKRKEEVQKLVFANDLHIRKQVTLRQSIKHSPFRVTIMGTNQRTDTSSTEISIWNDKQQYTEEFIDLLRDYYLYLWNN